MERNLKIQFYFYKLVVIIDYECVRVKVSFFLFTPHAYQYLSHGDLKT